MGSREFYRTTIGQQPSYIWALFVYFALIGLLAGMIVEVITGRTLLVDSLILNLIHRAATPTLDVFFQVVTQLGSGLAVVVIGLALATLLWARKLYRQSLVSVVGVGGAGLLIVVLKQFFGRARPDLWQHLVIEHSYSFPSGHSVASAALAALIITFTWNTRWRWPGLIIGLAYMSVVGFSRLYLGVHYPTDVLVGWMVGSLWVITLVAAGKLFQVSRRS